MTKKHKRSPYEDALEADAASAKAVKLLRGGQALRKPTLADRDRTISGGVTTKYSAATMAAPSAPAAERMSIEALEQKKMLLPYLDKIEYINVQLRQRGLLPDNPTRTAVLDARVAPVQDGGRDTVVASGKDKHHRKPIRPDGDAARESRNQVEATPQCVVRHRSESQQTDGTRSITRSNVATESLQCRYPRLVQSINRNRLAVLSPRVRPINWLLRLIEDVYDDLTEVFLLGANNVTPPPITDGSPRPELWDTEQASSPVARLVMPHLVRKHIETSMGLAHVVDQECLDLVYNVEANVEKAASVALFSMFVREIYDDDALLFFLFVRCIVQREFGLQLKAKTKQAHSSTTGKLFVAGDVVHFVAHSLVSDGSKTVLLTRSGCEQVWRRFFTHVTALNRNATVPQVGSRTPASPAVLSQFITAERMAELFNIHGQVEVEHLLVWSVDAFRNVAEDIVAQFKYKDDGESLRGLLRLRETITSDAKIAKLTTLYSERERGLRNMKIDLLRLERSNSDDNKNRTHLRLLKNQIGLLEQELEHIQAQITAAEGIVNDVWRDVTTTSPTKLKLVSQEFTGAGEFSNATKELSSVVGRFAAHMARLQRKHDIEVKARAMLAKPWKKQMEELQLRMVIKIQRAYRARRRAREIKRKAREELHEKIREREVQKQNELLARKRREALQEKDLQRHQARMLAMQQQEKAARDAIQQKQQQLVDRMRRERISEMDRERNRKLLHRLLKTWTAFLKMQEKRRDASRLFLKFQFVRWRHHFAAFKHVDNAARTIQRILRRRQEKRSLRKAVQMRRKRNAMAQRYLHKLQSRHMQRVFNQWIQWSAEQVRLKANFRAILQRRMDDWLQRWVRFVQTWKQRRLDATILVQRVYRGRLARRVFQAQRVRCFSAKTIQRVYRGFRGRNAASRRRQIKHHQDSQTAMLRLQIQHRLLGLCLAEWCTHTRRIRHTKRMTKHRRRRHLEDTFDGFACYRQHKREKRAAFVRRQYNSAVVIQRHYRRHRCQVVFRKSIVHHRAAIKIQRVYRGYEGRQRVRKLRWEVDASRKLQTAWRKRQARRLAEKTRAEGILLAAYKGDYTATQRAITSGYAYVVDQEHNTILHMAAAAGHKRLVKLCLRHHMDINAVNLHGQSPLHLLLTNIPPSLPGLDDDGETRRIIDERVALAAYMIDHSAWHEATDALGLTPLLLSAALGQTEATEMLLEKSANTDARSSAGLNAVQLTIEGNHPDTLRALLASRGFDTAANAGDTLRQLHACAGRGLIDCLRVLLEHMAIYELNANQFNLRDDDGYTPLIYAISNCNADAVQSLLESGASPDEKDFFGRPPLHFAVTAGDSGSSAILKLLTTYDVDVNVKDMDGDSALHTSCDCDARLECTSLLLRSGAANGANMLGNHPTHIAARCGAVETLKLLVEYGADMNIKNYEGKTPLGLARMLDQKAVVQYIKQYFAAEPITRADDEPPVAKGDAADGEHDEGDDYPTRTYEQWLVALTSAFRMGTLAEWTHYVDAETEYSFFTCPSADGEALTIFKWESPIEFDAALGDTWEVMRSGVSGVALGPRHYTGDTGEEDNNEKSGGDDKPSSRARAGPGVQYLYHNKRTGETRSAVPPIDYSLLQDVVQNSKRHQQLRQRIRKVSADTSGSAMEYMRFFREFEAESAQTRAEILAAIQIQRHFRARRTTRMVRLLLLENKRAIDLQRAFRGRQARKLVAHRRMENTCATKIQALWRGLTARRQEKTCLHAKRLDHRKRRRCALQIQRLFRGHRARLLAYREKVIQKQGPRGYFAWEQFRRRAVVKQSFKVWDEMELPLEFPGVFFYCHQVTRSCTWEKSKEWQAHDVEQFHERCQLFRWGYTQPMKRAAIRLQSLWRARQARTGFRLIMKAVQLMKGAEQEYLEDPTNLVKMGNYVLFLHAIRHDYERARPLYARLMRTMAQRGPDVPFILFSYALFLFVTQEDDVALVEDMILRAKRLDRQLLKYKLAFLGFFRQSMLQNPHDSESNLNYAACLQWLFEQYDESTPYYLRAIAANPHKKGSLELFQDMLNRKRQVDKARHPHLFAKPTGNVGRRTRAEDDELRGTYDAFEVFRRWQVQQAEQDDLRRRKQLEADQEVADRLQAARKIQARYRRRCAMRKVNRVRVERQLALSMADLADTKAVYDCVCRAFAQVAAPQPTTKFKFPKAKHATSSANPLSVPMAQLENIFRAMELSLAPDDMSGTIEAFRALHGKALHVNVMDVTSFVQSNALVTTKLKETRMGKAKG